MPSRVGSGFGTQAAAAGEEKPAEWEVTPGGMVVQRRDVESGPAAAAAAAAAAPTIRVKVKHDSVYHEIYVSSQATFGEVKKLLSTRVGMHPLDQKLLYKEKERDSAAFLDVAGVRDRSKLVLVEDPTAKAKRLLEQRRAEKMEKAAKSISAIGLAVDKLASKVSVMEAIVNKGGRVVEEDVIRLIELLMNELIKLDGVMADGDVKLQRKIQVRRVQKYVETLDSIKMKNAIPRGNGQFKEQKPPPESLITGQHHQTPAQYQQKTQQPPVVVTTRWETFDSLFMPSTSTPASTTTSIASSTPTTRLNWELF